MAVAVMAVAVIVAVIAVAVIGGCGWPVNDCWLWLAEFWLVRSLLAVISRVVIGCGWPGDAWLWLAWPWVAVVGRAMVGGCGWSGNCGCLWLASKDGWMWFGGRWL